MYSKPRKQRLSLQAKSSFGAGHFQVAKMCKQNFYFFRFTENKTTPVRKNFMGSFRETYHIVIEFFQRSLQKQGTFNVIFMANEFYVDFEAEPFTILTSSSGVKPIKMADNIHGTHRTAT